MAPTTFAPAGAKTPSAEFLSYLLAEKFSDSAKFSNKSSCLAELRMKKSRGQLYLKGLGKGACYM